MNLQEMKFLRFFTFAIAVISGAPSEDRRVECKHKFNVQLKNVVFLTYPLLLLTAIYKFLLKMMEQMDVLL